MVRRIVAGRWTAPSRIGPTEAWRSAVECIVMKATASLRVLFPSLAALVLVLILLVQPQRLDVPRYVPRRRRALRGSLVVVESVPRAVLPASVVRPAIEAIKPRLDTVTQSSLADITADVGPQHWPAAVSTGRCCALAPVTPLNVTLTWPVAMERPIVVLMRTGKLDASFACDVPCQYTTRPPPDAHVDVVVGEAARPTVPEQVRAANPHVLSAARSMESNLYYPSLRTLHKVVDAAMLTTLATSLVPVTYVARLGAAPSTLAADSPPPLICACLSRKPLLVRAGCYTLTRSRPPRRGQLPAPLVDCDVGHSTGGLERECAALARSGLRGVESAPERRLRGAQLRLSQRARAGGARTARQAAVRWFGARSLDETIRSACRNSAAHSLTRIAARYSETGAASRGRARASTLSRGRAARRVAQRTPSECWKHRMHPCPVMPHACRMPSTWQVLEAWSAAPLPVLPRVRELQRRGLRHREGLRCPRVRRAASLLRRAQRGRLCPTRWRRTPVVHQPHTPRVRLLLPWPEHARCAHRARVPLACLCMRLHVPLHAGSVIKRSDFESVDALAAHLSSLLADPAKYARYFAWKEAPLPRRFQQRMGALVATHAKCRLCKWAYARKYGFRWRQETQDVLLDQAPDGGPWRGPPRER